MSTITEILNNHPEEVTLVTHIPKPRHHADDVAATALLRILLDKYGIKHKTIHTFYPKDFLGYDDNTPNVIIYDIGLGMYDHHQPSPKDVHCLRLDSDGTTRKFSSVGLIWREIGHLLVPGDYVNDVYNNVIRAIDDQDNGNGFNPLSFCIGCMNTPANRTSTNETEAFEKAVDVMRILFSHVFENYIAKGEEKEEAEKIVASYKGKNYVSSDTYIATIIELCSINEIPFYIYPNSRDNGWCFRTITPVGGEMNDHIVDIPQEVRDWEGVTFLHPSGFLCSVDTKERAIEIIEKLCK